MRVIDLFSGLGGFSEAFVRHGYKVVRFDNDPQFQEVPYTVIKDVFDLKPKDIDADIILASPPCQCFSTAAAGYYWKGRTPTPAAQEAIRLVKYTVGLIHEARPRWWVLENPVGRLRWILGPPQILTYWAAWGVPYYKPTHIWGRLPSMLWPKPKMWVATAQGAHLGIQETNGQVVDRFRRYYDPSQVTTWAIGHLPTKGKQAVALRSLVPFAFSEALCLACERGIGDQLILED